MFSVWWPSKGRCQTSQSTWHLFFLSQSPSQLNVLIIIKSHNNLCLFCLLLVDSWQVLHENDSTFPDPTTRMAGQERTWQRGELFCTHVTFFHILQLQRSVLKFTACYLVGRSCSEIISCIISTFSELDASTPPKSKRHKVVVKHALADINQPLLDALNMSKQTQMVL